MTEWLAPMARTCMSGGGVAAKMRGPPRAPPHARIASTRALLSS